MNRRAWIESLFSTEPADRPRAEAAAQALYRALDFEAPQHMLWFENPSAGASAAALLLSSTNDLWGGIVAQVERRPEQRPAIERASERLRQINAGPGLEERLTGKRLFTDRLSLYPDLQAFQRASIFTDDDDLYRTESQFRGPERGVAGFQESAGRARLLINHSRLSIYPMSRMAADEAQAAGGPVPPLLEALWELARSSGPWWAFEHVILLNDRPCEVHFNDRLELHSPDGPTVVYRDGWPIYAWQGHAVEKPGPPEPFLMPGPEGHMPVRVRGKSTPRRISKSSNSFLERYRDGEYKELWDELIALGPAVRQSPYAEGARLVAEETMRRVAANVDTVIRRLESTGYRFRMKKGAHIPPGPQTDHFLKKLDDLAGPAPLSLATFYKTVGSVDLTGYHEQLPASSGGYFLPDPLVVFPLEQILLEYDARVGANFSRICIAPDVYHKADFWGGASYEMALPDARADGELLDERHGLFFVDYLRLAFRWGGFPGYDGMERIPGAVVRLRRDLLAF
jgi:hypothetical protein